jgi:hypothetical protein
VQIVDKANKIYHIDWSPDGKLLTFSRGPNSRGDASRVGTFQAAAEMVGAYARDWNIFVVSAERTGVLDLNTAAAGEVAQLTTNGASNKEPAWFRPSR